MSTNGVLTYPEIGSQALAIAEAWQQLQNQQAWVNKYLKSEKYSEVIFIGSGSSYYQSMVMAATYQKWLGKPARALPSSEILLFRDAAAAKNGTYLLIGVSRSGESTELILALNSVKDLDNWDICGISCYETSKLAEISECLISPLGKEQSTVMTRSFSSMTFMMQSAIAAASGHEDLLNQMIATREQAHQIVPAADDFIRDFVEQHTFNKVIYLGMGAYYGLAQEACLKLKEMSYVWTESYGTLEFRHGPKSIVDQGTLICLMLTESARSYELKVAQEMKVFGATILLITARAGEDTSFADAVFDIGADELEDEARAVLYMPAVHYYGYYSAMKLNLNPDDPKNLTQVVKI